MGIGGGPTPTIGGATIDGYIKYAKIQFDLFTFAGGGGGVPFYYDKITSDSLGNWDSGSAMKPVREEPDDFFLIRSKGGTDISTNKEVTDEFRMFLDTDMETIVANGWGANLDIITTIASYAVESFLPIASVLLGPVGDRSNGWAARIDTGGVVIASDHAFAGGRHDVYSPFKMIATTYYMLGLQNTYYQKKDFILDEDIEKATRTQQLEALVYILKNLYCDNNGKAIDGDTVLKAIGKTVVDVVVDVLENPFLFDDWVIKKIIQNIAETDGVESKAVTPLRLFLNYFSEFIKTVMNLVDAAPSSINIEGQFEERYKEIIKITEGIKLVVDESTDDAFPFYSNVDNFVDRVREKKDNITLGTIVRPAKM